MARVPAALLGNLGKPPTGGDLAAFLRFMRECPILQGALLEGVELSATTSVQRVRHGLGRAYRGALIAGRSSGGVTADIVNAADAVEPGTFLSVQLSAATATTINVWVF